MWTHLYLLFNSSVHSSRHYLWTLIPTLYWSSSGWSWKLPHGNSMGELNLSDPPWGYRALEAITLHCWEEIAERPKWALIFERDRGPLKGYCLSAINGCAVKLLYCANHWQMVIVIYDRSSWLFHPCIVSFTNFGILCKEMLCEITLMQIKLWKCMPVRVSCSPFKN